MDKVRCIALLVLVVLIGPINFVRVYLMNVWRWVLPAFGGAWHSTRSWLGTWEQFKQSVADEWNGVTEEEIARRERDRWVRQFGGQRIQGGAEE